MLSKVKLVLMGDGQTRQQGGASHVAVVFVSTYMPAGQRTVMDLADANDERPSGNTTRNFQTENGGPSCAVDSGWHSSVISVGDTSMKVAGCEKERVTVEVDRNTHDVLVTLAAVNRGKKNTRDETLGTQSTLMLLPVKAASADENAWTLGKTSRTETLTSLNTTNDSVTAGSIIFSAQM